MIRLVALACAWSACADDGGPRLSSVTPDAAPRGAMVALAGTRLCSGDCETAGGEIQIGLNPPVVRANIISYSDTAVEIVIPDLAPVGPTKLLVTVNEQASNALDFEVLAEASP
ncbi:MAG TPA: IPT/TIG domain-containing protein [Kofleriaceae bacterium]|nr:IPT/TIG domain-containing protein [Kofleriaceae bacterium]